MILKKLILLSCTLALCFTALAAAPEKRGNLETLCDLLFAFLISSEPVSDDTASYVSNLSKSINPENECVLRKFNTLGEYFFGRHNTVAIPFANYIICNTRELKKLPEESQRFVFGRALLSLSRGGEFYLYKLALPLICSAYCEVLESEDEQFARARLFPYNMYQRLTAPINPDGGSAFQQVLPSIKDDIKTSRTAILQRCIAWLLTAYTSRAVEYQLDLDTARAFDCTKGAIDFLKKYNAFEIEAQEQTTVSLIPTYLCTRLPVFELLNMALAPQLKRTRLQDYLQNGYQAKIFNVPLARVYPDAIIGPLKNSVPGQITPYSNRLANFIYSLPVIKYLSHFPTAKDRIHALRGAHAAAQTESPDPSKDTTA
jgi:hypothetical protein